MKDLLHGNIMLIICAAFYLLWWCVAFFPNTKVPKIISGPLIIFAAATGLVGGYIELRGLANMHLNQSLFSGFLLLAVGAIAYVVLMLITSVVLHRQVTTELLLIVGWVILQMAYVNALYGMGMVTRMIAMVLVIAIIVFGVLALIAYLAYYHLDPIPSYIDGMIPLILVIVMMIITSYLSK